MVLHFLMQLAKPEQAISGQLLRQFPTILQLDCNENNSAF
jgi:hypothetical protein